MSDKVAIVVDVEIKPEYRDEFLKVMEADAVGSRKEAGCLRFDVLCDQSNPNRFFFYEVSPVRALLQLACDVPELVSQVYTDGDAVAVHKEQPHFKLWSDFKASGGVVSSVSAKTSLPGDWAFSG